MRGQDVADVEMYRMSKGQQGLKTSIPQLSVSLTHPYAWIMALRMDYGIVN